MSLSNDLFCRFGGKTGLWRCTAATQNYHQQWQFKGAGCGGLLACTEQRWWHQCVQRWCFFVQRRRAYCHVPLFTAAGEVHQQTHNVSWFLGDENTSVILPTVGEGQLCFRTVPVSVWLHCSRGQWSARLHRSLCCGHIWSWGVESTVSNSGRWLS